ncbi:IclR family transcriptional regulator [Leucobacter sp. UT-8R-CII-1-4]|uniref:IclR family transcriptional regulator n=1 Tax=Leucobacter sp. UT-8R-CII-1-4 TaxID=3040075 RepID=UPI0024A7DD96|nr:IclR family transcriptional regulator [Leucobacter sp. UT-8R-CII-1-4]MDI6023651.1 IclR family transcriptional regulator [Leucobacter sp. UT-8R-CII-1-4]
MNASESMAGAQVVARISALLRALSSKMPEGTGTSDLARLTGISRPTAHRLLASLAAQGFVDRDQHSGAWLLGPELYLMGAIAADRYDISELARDHIAALAEATGESAFLSARRGNETVCLLREDGSFPIRSFVLFEGKRFPLGVASAGLAILSFLPEEQADAYLTTHDLTADHGPAHEAEQLRQRISETRARGYAINPGLIVEGSWGMGAAVFDRSGSPAWALSLTGIEPRFSPERQVELGRLLLQHAHRLTKALAGSR